MIYEATIDLIIKTVKERGLSYDTIADKAGISKTTVYRLMRNRDASAYTIGRVIAYLEIGEEVRKLDADQRPGEDEIHEREREVRAYYEHKAAAVREHYDQQIRLLEAQALRQEEERQRERETQKDVYDRSVAHLKEEIAKVESQRDRRGVLIFLLVIALFIALISDSIIV